GNLYAHALRNPVRLIDPDGRKVRISPALRRSRDFMRFWRSFRATTEGRRILRSLDRRGLKVYLRASVPSVRDAKVGRGIRSQGASEAIVGGLDSSRLRRGQAA